MKESPQNGLFCHYESGAECMIFFFCGRVLNTSIIQLVNVIEPAQRKEKYAEKKIECVVKLYFLVGRRVTQEKSNKASKDILHFRTCVFLPTSSVSSRSRTTTFTTTSTKSNLVKYAGLAVAGLWSK